MKRRIAAALLLMAGCSTNPIADVCDRFCPARGVCARTNSSPVGAPGAPGVPGAPVQPGCEAALKENQNYRKGLFERLRRSPPSGVPPAAVVPVANL